jgi:hypothetical protein
MRDDTTSTFIVFLNKKALENQELLNTKSRGGSHAPRDTTSTLTIFLNKKKQVF